MTVLAIAQNTFREAVRDRVLYVLLFFAAVAILGSKALGWISIGQDIKIVKSISLSSVSIFGVLIAIFVGTNLIYKEIDKRTVYTILCCPIHRWEFIAGKYLGLSMLLGLVCAVMAIVASLYVLTLGGTVDSAFIFAVVLIYAQLLLITAFATLLSSVTSPILGAIIVFSVYVLGNATEILVNLPPQLSGTSAQAALQWLYYVVPNLSNFNIQVLAANEVPVRAAYVGWAVLYAAVYTTFLLVLAAFAFEDKDV